MDSTLIFFLGAFIIMLSARPLANFLRLPVLSVYILWGILLGPSGFRLVKETETIRYFYHFGLILLMFSAGLELKHPTLYKNRRSLLKFFLFNGLGAGIVGILIGFFLALTSEYHLRHPSFNFLFGAIFSSSAIGIIVPFFYEFSYRSSHKMRSFISTLIGGTVLADILSLFVVSLAIFYFTTENLLLLGLLGLAIAAYLFLLLFGLPVLSRKMVGHPKIRTLSAEDQTRLLIVIILIAVALAHILKMHAIIAAFLAGIALANVRLDRRVFQNINFLSSGIFIPIFFLVVGVKTDLRIFRFGYNWVYPVIITLTLMGTKIISGFWVARRESFGLRESFGFGFATTPQLSTALAAAIAGYEVGLFAPVFLHSIILLALVSTFAGPIMSRVLLFPGTKHQEGYRSLEDYLSRDVSPLELNESLPAILTHVKGFEIPIYPVTDKNGIYQGVLQLSELRDFIFSEELNHLVIVADLISREFPVLYRDEPLERALTIFREHNYHAVPVLEATEQGDFYVGLVFLKDLLPDLT